MRGITDQEAERLRSNLPGTAPTLIKEQPNPEEIRRLNMGLLTRRLLTLKSSPFGDKYLMYETTPLGRIALYCYVATQTLTL